jgi:hypothetical protein
MPRNPKTPIKRSGFLLLCTRRGSHQLAIVNSTILEVVMDAGKKEIALDDLALMIHKGFSEEAKTLQEHGAILQKHEEMLQEIKKEIVDFRNENQQQHKQMRREYVPRSEFLEARAKI